MLYKIKEQSFGMPTLKNGDSSYSLIYQYKIKTEPGIVHKWKYFRAVPFINIHCHFSFLDEFFLQCVFRKDRRGSSNFRKRRKTKKGGQRGSKMERVSQLGTVYRERLFVVRFFSEKDLFQIWHITKNRKMKVFKESVLKCTICSLYNEWSKLQRRKLG